MSICEKREVAHLELFLGFAINLATIASICKPTEINPRQIHQGFLENF